MYLLVPGTLDCNRNAMHVTHFCQALFAICIVTAVLTNCLARSQGQPDAAWGSGDSQEALLGPEAHLMSGGHTT